jgi:endonuclease/exonuclease/phosphatase family metal-dependent hydrolase
MFTMFVPVLPLALVALLWDVLQLGRALRKRWLLSLVAVSCGALALSWQWRPAMSPELAGEHSRLRVVQWNTMWGGRNSGAFKAIIDRIDAERPDIVCLSEAPDLTRLEDAWRKRHPSWSVASASHGRGFYWYNLAIVSRYPVRQRGVRSLATGRFVLFEVEHPVRTLRIAMVDLLSSPRSPRSPSIVQVAELLEASKQAGEAIDLVAGDFNTPARFLGFDALESAADGYRRAALWSGAWRATWPSFPFAVFDIDHVFVSKRLQIRNAAFFTTFATDHRGQRVDLSLPH